VKVASGAPASRISIREAVPHEYEAVGALVVDAYRTLGDADDTFYERRLRDVAGRAADAEVLIAEVEGVIVGTVTYAGAASPLAEVDDPEAATIRMLGVASEARGRGVGEALARACIDRARSGGLARVRLNTRTSMTTAQRLYERIGFRREPEHDWSPAPGVDLLGYVLELDPAEDPR
jgi:ribosomal protein S18 acetylase RimI-like enzyme